MCPVCSQSLSVIHPPEVHVFEASSLFPAAACSEKNKGLLDVTFNALHFLSNDIEAHRLGKRAALSNSDDITDFEAESGGAMGCDSLVALLKTVVFLHEMKIITADDNVPVHLV